MVKSEEDEWLEFAGLLKPEQPTRRCSPDLEEASADEFCDWFDRTPDPLIEPVAPVVPLPSALDLFRPFSAEEELEAIKKISRQLLTTGPFSFLHLSKFEGNGIYALYYQGSAPEYEALRSLGSTCPMYIGSSCTEKADGLHTRLKTHAKSLRMTAIGLENLTFRFVRLPDTIINFAEPNIIRFFDPLWNDHLRGFGERPGKGRSTFGRDNQTVSPWDTWHPGRPTGGALPRDLDSVQQLIQDWVPRCRQIYDKAMTLLGLPS